MPTFLSAVTTIYSSDIAKATDFYSRVLGFQETYRFPREGAPEHVEFRVGGATIAVSSAAGLRSHNMLAATPGHPFELGFETDDVDATVSELRTRGVTIMKEPSMSPAGIRYAYIVDPDGTWISLYRSKKN
jgi:catechol 2,3-dioxygenase-like lactoylglutathione lyase family enzyme